LSVVCRISASCDAWASRGTFSKLLWRVALARHDCGKLLLIHWSHYSISIVQLLNEWRAIHCGAILMVRKRAKFPVVVMRSSRGRPLPPRFPKVILWSRIKLFGRESKLHQTHQIMSIFQHVVAAENGHILDLPNGTLYIIVQFGIEPPINTISCYAPPSTPCALTVPSLTTQLP
jgi:hypothetical protein